MKNHKDRLQRLSTLLCQAKALHDAIDDSLTLLSREELADKRNTLSWQSCLLKELLDSAGVLLDEVV